MDERLRIVDVRLDGDAQALDRRDIQHDRNVAIFDLLEENHFEPTDGTLGPFTLHLRVAENRMVFDVRDEADAPMTEFTLPGTVFRSIIRDYFVVCESYYEAIKTATPSKIQAIDMGRRGLHNEGAELMRERLAPHVNIDLDTSRRLFTLICVLHLR
ncbi:MAG: UPF0262 family protein [Rhodospirillales bacterium]|nr:UPF0262 family protein [Rhodospirillales bacterium]